MPSGVARRTRPLPVRRRQPPPAGLLPGRATDPSRRRGGRALRGLGAERRARLGGRRFQQLGRASSAMRRRYPSGVWELFVPAPRRANLQLQLQGRRPPAAEGRPLALACETPPGTASKTCAALRHEWRDQDRWPGARSARLCGTAVDLQKSTPAPGATATAGRRTWSELAEELIPYVRQLGFTHIELMPVMEHPFGGSGATSRSGCSPPPRATARRRNVAAFVDACHQAGIGVILDWARIFPPTPGLGRLIMR